MRALSNVFSVANGSNVSLGGGAIGSSTAYFLTHHARFTPNIHSVTILEAGDIAGGSSGKSGGLLASWATPKCLAPLSFKTHAELAKKHGGDKLWGHRYVHAAEVDLEARNLDGDRESASIGQQDKSKGPSGLNWLLPGSLKSYNEIGTPSNTAQINSYLYTTIMAKLAQEKGAAHVCGRATTINYTADKECVSSVTYTDDDGETHSLESTDIVVAAGPWTPHLLPRVKLLTPRGHSVVVQPSHDLSPHVLFPSISAAPNSTFSNLISPEIYPRPPDAAHPFDTIYASGPDDYDVKLPSSTESVVVDAQRAEDVWTALKSVSRPIHDGEILVRQACYKPQIRKHEEDEEVGPMVGKVGKTKGLWLATGHDEWGMSNSAGTGVVMSEMIWEGEAKSADCEGLDPKHFLENE